MIDDKFKKDLIARTDLRRLMEERGVKFDSSGRANCVVHDDGHPSMTINPKFPVARCWSCGWSGDAISFLQVQHGMDFMTALKELAAWHGVEIPRDNNWKPTPDKVDAFKEFSKKIMNTARQTANAKAKMNGGQSLANAGIGYLPEVIKHPHWVKFLNAQPKEYLDLAGIAKDGENYNGGGRYIWNLERKFKTVGFVRFDKNPKTPVHVKTLDNQPGYALGDGRRMQWNTMKFLNVSSNVLDAIKLHDMALAWGPGAYYPHEQFGHAPLHEDIAQEFFRHEHMRFISYDKIDVMKFIAHLLPIISDGQIVKIVNPNSGENITRDSMRYAPTMSAHIRKYLKDNPEQQKAYIERITKLITTNEKATFYRPLLIDNLQELALEKPLEVDENGMPDISHLEPELEAIPDLDEILAEDNAPEAAVKKSGEGERAR